MFARKTRVEYEAAGRAVLCPEMAGFVFDAQFHECHRFLPFL